MSQMLLFPDPRPLVERLGLEFFRQAPQCPGVYLMRDRTDTVLYVGKAKNLRRRLANYRVANPDRMRRRHLRLLRAIERVEFRECADESVALATESELLRSLRPRFNRAGTWPAMPRFLGWRLIEEGLSLSVTGAMQFDPRHSYGPLGTSVFSLRAALVRLLWCALEPARRLSGMPEGWFSGRFGETATIPRSEASGADFAEAEGLLTGFFTGHAGPLTEWICDRTATQTHPFEVAVRATDLESVTAFAERLGTAER
jgi:predicted GIY-YIG superfamily endonuclease